MNRFLLLIIISSIFFSCEKTGTPLDNLAPETKMFVDEINLSGNVSGLIVW